MNMPNPDIETYYDAHVKAKLVDFVEGNRRVSLAWKTVREWAVPNPRRILEIGCGIGNISWRMARHWPHAEVIGLDMSPRSIEIAKRLFDSRNLRFVKGTATSDIIKGSCDMIVLMDVYEHIAISHRARLNMLMGAILSEEARIILSFPTPAHIDWLKRNRPEEIQPIDEDIGIDTILSLADDTNCQVLLYKQVDVWREGDYAHAALARRRAFGTRTKVTSEALSKPRSRFLAAKEKLLFFNRETVYPSRSERLSMVCKRLGSDFYPK